VNAPNHNCILNMLGGPAANTDERVLGTETIAGQRSHADRRRVFPAIDIQKSGTRKEGLLLPREDHMFALVGYRRRDGCRAGGRRGLDECV